MKIKKILNQKCLIIFFLKILLIFPTYSLACSDIFDKKTPKKLQPELIESIINKFYTELITNQFVSLKPYKNISFEIIRNDKYRYRDASIFFETLDPAVEKKNIRIPLDDLFPALAIYSDILILAKYPDISIILPTEAFMPNKYIIIYLFDQWLLNNGLKLQDLKFESENPYKRLRSQTFRLM